jgi:hypothetical protein
VGSTSEIPAVGRLKQKYHKFEANLGYTESPCFKKAKGRQGILKGSLIFLNIYLETVFH